MPYDKVLNKIIVDSGYTIKEVAEKCTKLGTPIDRSYLSKLLNKKNCTASEEKSRAISQVCGADERLLVLESYLDKAPKEIRDALNSIRYMTIAFSLNTFRNKVDKGIFDIIRDELQSESLSEFLIDIIEKGNCDIDLETEALTLKDLKEKTSFTFNDPVYLKVADNALSPIVPENAKVKLSYKEQYETGDLVAIHLEQMDSFSVLVRYLSFDNDFIVLTGLDKKYKKMIFPKNEVTIIGIVSRVTIDL